jgi:alpha-amylase/alpha-mannosidase (GH57 family)
MPVRLVLCWHMHQPDFREGPGGRFRLPWVYLHAVKDYADMAAHLERHPGVRAVVNFVPVLLDQIEDYVAAFDAGDIRDPLLEALVQPDMGAIDASEREFLLDRCFRANHAKMIEPFPAYLRLREVFRFAETQGHGALDYLSPQYFADLVTWYHLAWTGETVRRQHAGVVELMSKGHGFTAEDRRRLFEIYREVIRGVLPRWRALAERGQVELSCTPHDHPLGPLLLDFASARETQPALPLPRTDHYPGGRSRVEAHLARALESHARRFGTPARGVWPAEGALSEAMLDLIAQAGLRWTASGEGVLRASLALEGRESEAARAPYRGHRWRDTALSCFFRDDRLSDLVGFEYRGWHGRDAAAHFLAEVEGIAAAAPPGEDTVLSVILDGENAWEYYPYNGYYFFEDLYGALAGHTRIRTTTYASVLKAGPAAGVPLSKLCAGSWVYGNLSTWIGSVDKNRAWDLLCEAKRHYDLVLASGRLDASAAGAASRQLAVCESSDWFWWFGDYNPRTSVEAMDAVFRANLAALYRLLQLPAPAVLDSPLSHGSAGEAELGGAMRRASS